MKMSEEKFDEFYGRDRDTELDQIDDKIKEIAETLPEKEKTLLLDEACHLDDSCFRVASHLNQVLLLTPRDKYKEIMNQTVSWLSRYLEWEVNQFDGPLHPNFDLDKDYDRIDKLIERFQNKVSKLSF